ncbi:unnamed protein product [Anisakis simplex]|uniref:Transposase n=1 Tax=Anisakis simplex TaxID=6269 RepID=A0A0M3JIY4_ANISI|nr:unnamed protein product [Anisakis simplex]
MRNSTLKISTNGYVGFAQFSDNAHDLRVGVDTDWPRESDPALIAPYLCKYANKLSLQIDQLFSYRAIGVHLLP